MWVSLNNFRSNNYIQYMEVVTQIHIHHNVSANKLHSMQSAPWSWSYPLNFVSYVLTNVIYYIMLYIMETFINSSIAMPKVNIYTV